ncbi:soyasaponin III rhamnosyltransferase-like [Pyrus ussuriensis x Pyrus communis]|uniref:Soyasaponin III rhamnosyltransferase-like n=1 Tax=Pyrus ussuriensis x Pyrus communis TaxID=2448454 RepID=A0A5N5F3U9_9ROSA|nr:soyasaponin III rhamnosyltransferase-like [Pyrus ussuriensis x Pyrus communis]
MEKDDHLSVVMLPWSAFGHMMPFFQLSIALPKAKVHVSFISTPKNIKRSQNLARFTTLCAITEATVDIPFENTDNLKIAYDLLQKPIKQFIADRLPDWIITDFAAHWVVEIGREYGVPLVYFSVFSAATRLVFRSSGNLSSGNTNDVLPSLESLTLPPDLVTFQSTVAFREHEAVRMHAGFYGGNESGISDAERNAKILSACQVLAVRSCDEFEGEYLEAYKNNSGKLKFPLIYEWLDKQKARSVVFVGLLEEKGMAVEVKRRGDGSFSRDDIAKRLRHAMVEEGGEQLRSNARKAGTVFGNHKLHQDHYIGQFVNFLKNNTTERSSCF